MFRMPGRSIDRLLQIHFAVNVPEEKLRRPLILLVAARRTPGQIRLTIAQGERRAECRTRSFTRRESGGMFFIKPECLRARAKSKTKLGNYGRRLQPAAGWRRWKQVFRLFGDVEIDRISTHFIH